MSTELIYAMRTCAAALAAGYAVGGDEIAELLIQASNKLEEPIGELMPAIPRQDPQAPGAADIQRPFYTWGGVTLDAKARPCPSCGSIDARTVRRVGKKLQLTCPRCEHEWEFGR